MNLRVSQMFLFGFEKGCICCSWAVIVGTSMQFKRGVK